MKDAARGVLVFDGECEFCRFWVERWRRSTGPVVEYLARQDAAVGRRFPDLDPAALREAVHLVEPDGRVTRGATAALRTLALAPRGNRWASWCLARPAVMRIAETVYRWVARNRGRLGFLMRG